MKLAAPNPVHSSTKQGMLENDIATIRNPHNL